MADQRERIIASVFSRRNASGRFEKSYISHIKVWEEAEGGRKPRYILLAQAISGSGFIHKSKLNTNGRFSVGKTWRLAELRALSVISPWAFDITLSRTYRWQTENKEDQAIFLDNLVRVFRTVTNGQVSLHLDGVQDYNIFSPGITYQRDIPSTPLDVAANWRDHNARISHFDPSNQATAERLIVDAPGITYQRDIPSVPLDVANRRDHNARFSHFDSSNQATADRLIADAPSITYQRDIPSTTLDVVANRRDHDAQISYFDPSNQATADRLIVDAPETELDGEGVEENAQATLENVEEMIKGYEWVSEDVIGRKMSKGAVDLIEARLLDELMALEKANIHSFLESDDRLTLVMKHMDEAISEIDNMESLIYTYKIHLNTVNDDILYIQSQNKGLQVQTQNQRALLGELQNLVSGLHSSSS